MTQQQKKVAVFTGTRAEYGLLYWLLKDIQDDPELKLQLLVSGMHLSPEFGETYHQIEQDGFVIDEKIEILLSSDSAVGTDMIPFAFSTSPKSNYFLGVI